MTKKPCQYDAPKMWLFQPNDSQTGISKRIISVGNTAQEARAMQIYQEVLIVLLGNFNTAAEYFWTCVVPQTSQQEAAIKYQLIATASLEDSLMHTSTSRAEAEMVATRYYGKALTLLAHTTHSRDKHIMLVSCLLSIAMENMRGDATTALLHCRHGLQVTREWKQERLASHLPLSGSDEIIDEYIEPIFAQLEAAAAMMYIKGRHVAITPIENLTYTRPLMPDEFPSLVKAREKFFELGNWMYYQERSNPGSYVADHPVLKQNLKLWSSWHSAFLRFKHKQRPYIQSTRSQAQLQLLLLETHYHNHFITLLCQSRPVETASDEYISAFQSHIAVCAEVVSSLVTYQRVTDPLASDFDFDPGVLPPLWQTAITCRDPPIRHRALELLRLHHRRCGHEDDCSSAAMCEAIIKLEEDGIANPQTCADIPEEKRLRVLYADLTHPGQMTLTVTRAPYVVEEVVTVPLRLTQRPTVAPFKLFPMAESMRLAGYQGLVRPRAVGCRCKSYGGS